MKYISELWIGRAKGYWNWEIKGFGDDDFKGRAKACEDFLEEVQSIKKYYEDLSRESKGG